MSHTKSDNYIQVCMRAVEQARLQMHFELGKLTRGRRGGEVEPFGGGGEATAGSDYTSVNQTLTFAAGQTQQTVQVAIGQDSALESNETFSLTLSSPSAGNIETASASLTINDDDQSTWSIAANASAKSAES